MRTNRDSECPTLEITPSVSVCHNSLSFCQGTQDREWPPKMTACTLSSFTSSVVRRTDHQHTDYQTCSWFKHGENKNTIKSRHTAWICLDHALLPELSCLSLPCRMRPHTPARRSHQQDPTGRLMSNEATEHGRCRLWNILKQLGKRHKARRKKKWSAAGWTILDQEISSASASTPSFPVSCSTDGESFHWDFGACRGFNSAQLVLADKTESCDFAVMNLHDGSPGRNQNTSALSCTLTVSPLFGIPNISISISPHVNFLSFPCHLPWSKHLGHSIWNAADVEHLWLRCLARLDALPDTVTGSLIAHPLDKKHQCFKLYFKRFSPFCFLNIIGSCASNRNSRSLGHDFGRRANMRNTPPIAICNKATLKLKRNTVCLSKHLPTCFF